MPPARAGGIAALVLFLFAWTLTTHGKFSASGDEPHYLMIAESLRSDRDLDLANNYARNDGRRFGHERLAIGAHARTTQSGRVWSVHDIGLPVFLLPAYTAAQRIALLAGDRVLRRFRMTRGLFAYSLVSLFLMAIAAIAAGRFAERLTALTESPRDALLASIALASPPIVCYTFLVFPETVALVATLVVLWYVLDPARRGGAMLLVIAVMLGLLPWVHRKYSLYASGLLFLVLVRRGRSIREAPASIVAAAAALFAVPQGALHLWTWWHWGTIGGPQLVDTLPFSAGAFASGLTGLWIDRVHGVVAYGPLFLLVPACIWIEWRTAWPFLVPVALLWLPMAAFVDWIGGFSTAARYLVPALPLLLVPLALALRRRAVRAAFWILLALQLAIDAVVWQHPRTLWPGTTAVNPALDRLGAVGRFYARLLPPVWTDGFTTDAALLLLALAVVSTAVVAMARRDADLRRAFSATM